ncbi:DUF3850 domain-containing protein [Paenibacillus macerans]|uniref:DUF3850 domain-containing protein n=1 Tax=Paenibacillus macerans TaxID=44252 RepID=A0A6N8F019_PAEMA|nr:DUF3850 domain-containing protein [Paenibacillus macerans]MEC0329184.1 DUF3850 domain-containing protein [Paenibacillus macerans]MUG25359.1 DUF3850 domain-containing protein [Paenibacillus macerans]
MEHHLKINTEFFEPVLRQDKSFEIRKNDRNYLIGDLIILNEWEPSKKQYTGRKVKGVITYITDFEQKDNYVVFSFKLINDLSELEKRKK